MASFGLLAAKTDDYSIVFVHIGSKIPSYAATAISQARLFNPDCKIIMLGNDSALNDFQFNHPNLKYDPIACESLEMSPEHKQFLDTCSLDTEFWNGFWKYTSERFLYLYDLISQFNMQNVFHMEYDNMLYVDLKELLPCFQHYYKGIGATFDNDSRCIPGFIFIKDRIGMQKLAKCFSENAGSNDMIVLSLFKMVPAINALTIFPL